MTRSLLMVFETAFRSGWVGSTSRLLQIVSGLKERGWNTTLLTGQRISKDDGWAQEEAFAGKVVRTPFSGAYPSSVSNRWLRRLWREWWSMTGRARYHSNPEYGWGGRVVDWCVRSGEVTRPDVVFAISTGSIGSLVAGRNLAGHFDCPLLVEFRDPCPRVSGPPPSPAQKHSLESCLESSVAIVTTTKALADHLTNAYAFCEGKVFPVYSCFDDSVKPTGGDPKKRDQIVLLHAGTLYGETSHNMRSIVRGLAKAFENEPSMRGQVRLRLLGGDKGMQEAVRVARECGIPEMVESLPQAPLGEAVREMDAADVLILIISADLKFDMQIPGKLFQYLGRGKPILGIMPHTEAADILVRSGLGVMVENDDVDSLTQAVVNLWRQRNHLHEVCKPDWEYIAHFSQTRMVEHINQLLENLLSTGCG